VPGVRGSHHVLGIKHLLSEFRNSDGTVLCAATGSQGRETSHEEVKTRERNCRTIGSASLSRIQEKRTLTHVDSELPQIRVELTREPQARCNTGHDDRDKVVEITVCWCRQFESPKADVVESLIINAESLVRVLYKLMH
jgi:hypothetical protein